MKIKRTLYRISISAALTMLLGYSLLRQINYKSIFDLFGSINYFYIALSFMLYFFMSLVRAVRVKILLAGNDTDMKKLFAIILVNNFLINFLPFRMGDLTFPVLMNKYAKTTKKEGLLMLFYLRVLDAYVILLFLLISVLLFSNNIFRFSNLFLLSVVLILILATVLFFKSERILLLFRGYLRKKNKFRYTEALINGTNKMLVIYKFYRSTIPVVFVLSVAIFIILVFVLGFALKAYPISLNYINVIFISLVIITITSLPINGVAGLGTVEFGVSAFLISTGISKNLAISIAFNYHFVTLVFIIIFGGLSYLYLNHRKRLNQ